MTRLLLAAIFILSGCIPNSEDDSVCMAASRRALDISIEKVVMPHFKISRQKALATMAAKGQDYETSVRWGANLLHRQGGCVMMLYMSEDALEALAREELLR